MMKIIFFIFVSLFSLNQVYAQQYLWDLYNRITGKPTEVPAKASIGGCIGGGCDKTGTSSPYEAYPFKNSYFKASKRTANCNEYISNQNGLFGNKGLKLQALMYKYPVFYKSQPSADMPNVCRRFSGFTENQKVHFWMWFWASLSLDESTCGKDRVAQGVNSVAVGDFQMEKPLAQRKAAGRPKPCLVPSVDDFNNNAACAVAIMARQLESKNKLFVRPSYWQKLNPGSGNAIKSLVSKYPGCGN